ncbi:MAG: hypothetical protein LBQ67_07615 [Treponema sp.]|jgi:hypothetical protein|nr:hypothetical protein [Treponema sp.]
MSRFSEAFPSNRRFAPTEFWEKLSIPEYVSGFPKTWTCLTLPHFEREYKRQPRATALTFSLLKSPQNRNSYEEEPNRQVESNRDLAVKIPSISMISQTLKVSAAALGNHA